VDFRGGLPERREKVRSKAGPQEAAACVTIVGYIRWGSWLDGLAEFTCPFFTLYCTSITTYAGHIIATHIFRHLLPTARLTLTQISSDHGPWYKVYTFSNFVDNS